MAVIAFLRRWRAWLTIVPLVVGLGVAGSVGAHLLWTQASASSGGAVVTCWNGERAAVSDCGRPAGEAGLAWVFPGLDPSRPTCSRVAHASTPAHPAPFEVRCDHTVGGRHVSVTYSIRSSVAAGLTFLAKQYPGVRPERSASTGRVTWHRSGHGTAELTSAYQAYPYSVTITAPTLSVCDRALATLVHFRSPGQIVARAHS